MSFLLLIVVVHHWIATGSIPEKLINKQTINHDYIVVTWYNMDWLSADTYCQQNYDSNLATILTQKDYDLLYSYSNGIGMIGLKRNEQTGEWSWIDNTLQHNHIDLNTNNHDLYCSKIKIITRQQYEITAVDCNTVYDKFYCNKATSYIYVERPMTYTKAEKFCNIEYGTHLATITRWLDIQNAQHVVQNNNNEHIWIGLYENDNKNFWLDGTEYNENYMNNLFELNGINSKCHSLNLNGNYIINNNNECGDMLPFLCNKRRKVREYILYQKTMSFIEAQKYCLETHGTDLATIITEEEFSDAMKLIPQFSEGVWIGLNKQNEKWNWIDNTQCTQYNDICIPYWLNNGIIIEPIYECAYLWKMGGRARTSVCTESMKYFLCNKPVIEINIMDDNEQAGAQIENENIESSYSIFHGKKIYYLHANEPYDATYKIPKSWIVMAGYIAVSVILVSILIYACVYCLFLKHPSKRKMNRSRISAV